MKAIILSAGQGRRLLPLTADRPKCLLPVDGQCVLDWQLAALAEAGVSEVVVVSGFQSDLVQDHVARRSTASFRVRTELNPFYAVADNIGSCYVARSHMEEDFLLLNGDTLVEPATVAKLLSSRTHPVTVTVDRKPWYDDDDMKVALDGDCLTAIGKTLPLEQVDAESIGLLMFRGEGTAIFRRGMETVLRQPDGLGLYYLSVINASATTGQVGVCDIQGHGWAEIDFPADVAKAERLTQDWLSRGWAATPMASSSLAG